MHKSDLHTPLSQVAAYFSLKTKQYSVDNHIKGVGKPRSQDAVATHQRLVGTFPVVQVLEAAEAVCRF
jgi:hypothetical protein